MAFFPFKIYQLKQKYYISE